MCFSSLVIEFADMFRLIYVLDHEWKHSFMTNMLFKSTVAQWSSTISKWIYASNTRFS
jgi:hypothetical protein